MEQGSKEAREYMQQETIEEAKPRSGEKTVRFWYRSLESHMTRKSVKRGSEGAVGKGA